MSDICIRNVRVYPNNSVGGSWRTTETWAWNNPVGGEVVSDNDGTTYWWDINGGWGDVSCSDWTILTKTVWADIHFTSHFSSGNGGNFGSLQWDQLDQWGNYAHHTAPITVPQYVTEMRLCITISGSSNPCSGRTMVPCVNVVSTNPPG